jgi:hypothetical protein
MEYVAIAAAVFSGIQSIKQGREQGKLLEMQGTTALLQSRGEAVKYEQQANNVLRRALETQAAARARAAAGGIDPFSGSAQFIQDLSAKAGGEEFNLSRENAKLVALGGEIQFGQSMQAARNARRAGLISGLTSFGTAGASAAKIGGPTAAATPPISLAYGSTGGLGLKPTGGLGLR